MKTGRNDPCPCGSGKKYKKCCLDKDEQARRSEEPLPAPTATFSASPLAAPPPPDDPLARAVHARWKEFEAADDEGKVAVFLRTLEEPDLMEGEMAFEMMGTLQMQFASRGDGQRLDEIAEALRTRLPEVYAREAAYILSWRIAHALAAGRTDAVPALARELAAEDRRHSKLFDVIDQLAYHGQLAALLDLTTIAWPGVRQSADLLPWAVDSFARQAANVLIFTSLERQRSPDAGDPALLESLRTYLTIDPAALVTSLGYLTGQTKRQWTMSDFDFAPLPEPPDPDGEWEDEEDEWDEEQEEIVTEEEGETEEEAEPAPSPQPATDPARQNLFSLSLEYLGYLRRVEGVSYTRGELAREQIVRYLLARFDGNLVWRPSMLEAALHPERAKAKRASRPPAHLLCPDRETLERHLKDLIGFLNAQEYKMAALFGLLPAWLRFLESRRLIDARLREESLRDISGLSSELLQRWDQDNGRPGAESGDGALARGRRPAGRRVRGVADANQGASVRGVAHEAVWLGPNSRSRGKSGGGWTGTTCCQTLIHLR